MLGLTRRPPASPVVLAVAGVLAVALGGCTSETPFDRGAAVAKVVKQGNGAFTEEQAGCYVDRVVADVGAGVLADGARPTPGQIDRLTTIRLDCAGATSIGRSLGSTLVGPVGTLPSGRSEPMHRGQDIRLDLLWDACERGDGVACDSLFDAAPIGSDYEEFGYTCGQRTREVSCAERYGGTGVADPGVSSTAVPSP